MTALDDVWTARLWMTSLVSRRLKGGVRAAAGRRPSLWKRDGTPGYKSSPRWFPPRCRSIKCA